MAQQQAANHQSRNGALSRGCRAGLPGSLLLVHYMLAPNQLCVIKPGIDLNADVARPSENPRMRLDVFYYMKLNQNILQ